MHTSHHSPPAEKGQIAFVFGCFSAETAEPHRKDPRLVTTTSHLTGLAAIKKPGKNDYDGSRARLPTATYLNKK